MQAVDRHRKMVGKDDAQDKLIKYMYETKAGRVITSFLIKPWLSETQTSTFVIFMVHYSFL